MKMLLLASNKRKHGTRNRGKSFSISVRSNLFRRNWKVGYVEVTDFSFSI